MRSSVLLMTAVMLLASAITAEKAARQPKLFFVTSSTSTSVSTTTSMLRTSFTCYMISKTAIDKVCPQGGKRRKRALSLIDESAEQIVAKRPEISVSRVSRKLEDPAVESGLSPLEESKRQAKFAWYYMTTTVTSISTSTSTSTTFTATLSVSLLNCTPSEFSACG